MNTKKHMGPKVLFYDIETAPFPVWTFQIGRKVTIPHSAIMEGYTSDIICIAYKWAHEKEVHVLDWGWEKQDSRKMIAAFDKVIAEADIIIAHNGDRFDWRHLNTQRMMQGLPGIDWETRSEDTLKQIRRHFYLPSYRLDYLGKLLNVGKKDGMVFQDWIDIRLKTDSRKLEKMKKYCKQDVRLLESVYNRVKAYMKPKMSAAAHLSHQCTVCGSDQVIKNGLRKVNGATYQSYYCNSHGGHAGRAKLHLNGSDGGVK